jgi:hypothetical protein
VAAEASSLAKPLRDAEVSQHPLITTLMRQYHNLDEVAADADKLFKGVKPVFLLLADSKGLMQVEIGQGGRYAMTRSQRGTMAHTNHYGDTSLIDGEQRIGKSSATRLARVQSLLATAAGPHTLDEFGRISADQHDGPNDSLWRDGREHTLAGWQIALLAGGAPKLHLVLANPGKAKQGVDWTLDAAFWSQAEGRLLGHGAAAAAS